MTKLVHRRGHAEARRSNYPPIGDALDAVAKGLAALRDAGVNLPTDTLAWLCKCEQVKRDYPKDR